MKLEKWMPFRFGRPTKGDQPATLQADERTWTDPLATIQNEVNRLFTRFWGEPFAHFGALDTWFGDYRPKFFRPVIDVIDKGQALEIIVELPGLEDEDVELAVEDGMLVLRGEKKIEKETEEEGVFRIERSFGTFERSIPLPVDVDTESIDARFEKGVLTIQIPKNVITPAEKKRIPIHA